jgi:hypothetical protein
MKLRRTLFALLQLSGVFYLTNCMGRGTTNNPGEPTTISMSPLPTSVAAGATVTFTAVTTNANGLSPVWTLEVPGGGSPVGSMGTLSAETGTTVTYTAPSTPPIYTGSIGSQGTVVVEAAVDENTSGCNEAYATASFVITAPTVTVGLSPATALLAVGLMIPDTQVFAGYAVGNVNGGLTWQVNGVTGGSTTFGTISPTGNNAIYTPPVAVPMTGNTVTITMISQADPSKTATATVTLH